MMHRCSRELYQCNNIKRFSSWNIAIACSSLAVHTDCNHIPQAMPRVLACTPQGNQISCVDDVATLKSVCAEPTNMGPGVARSFPWKFLSTHSRSTYSGFGVSLNDLLCNEPVLPIPPSLSSNVGLLYFQGIIVVVVVVFVFIVVVVFVFRRIETFV